MVMWPSWRLVAVVVVVVQSVGIVAATATAAASFVDSIAWCQLPLTPSSTAIGPHVQRRRRQRRLYPPFVSLVSSSSISNEDDDTDFVGSPENVVQCHDDQVQLSGGTSRSSPFYLQVLTCVPPPATLESSAKQTMPPSPIPVLLFLHGSFHGAWCWREHFLPFFASLGYISVAVSWRGTSGSPLPLNVNAGYSNNSSNRKIPISNHVADLQQILTLLPGLLQDKQRHVRDDSTAMAPLLSLQPPVLIAHSFGGLVVMKYLEDYYGTDSSSQQQQHPQQLLPWSGIVSLCSVPPSGNGPLTVRYLQTSLLASWRIVRGLALKHCGWDARLCRTLFFDDTVDDVTLSRYQDHLTADSKVTVDLRDLATQLPSKQTDPDTGQALFLATNEDAPAFPCLVVGATRDYIVDAQGVEETARYFFGTATTTIRHEFAPPLPLTTTNTNNSNKNMALQWVNSTHDVMLGAHWKRTADAIHQWLNDNHLHPRG